MTENIPIKVKKLPHARPGLPYYATAGSAGMDLAACISEPVTLVPRQRLSIPTGIALQIPHPGIVGLVFPRSGLAARQGLTLANSVGVIDSDYTGEILCILVNHGNEDVTIFPGDRIAQILFMPVCRAELFEVDELTDTHRGTGGFGSTGVQSSHPDESRELE